MLAFTWTDNRRHQGFDIYANLTDWNLVGVAELPIHKAALVRIDVARPLRTGGGILHWLLPPDLLAATKLQD